ncbi:MAG: NYN domain-containing protein [Candidatus Niyogibacteria bacterium]|nr:NYN domain-containing protein [Candidatus Niyogibacteria bacterium]
MPVIRHKEQRVAVLIDVQNMYHSARNLYGKRVNFKEILKQAVANRKLVRAIGYVIKTPSGEEAAFFEALEKIGIEPKNKDIQIFAGGVKKADWDVGLTIDAVRLAPRVDTIVLVTGDGDFVPLVEYLKEGQFGIQVEVMAFGRSASAKLREHTDSFTDLDENPKFLLGIPHGKRDGRDAENE